jgi:hypothetical protein
VKAETAAHRHAAHEDIGIRRLLLVNYG